MLGEPIRIAIIGEQGLFQDALASSLASQADFRLAGCFFPLEQALPVIQAARVDVLLLAMIPDRQTEAGIITGADAAGFRGSVLTIIAGTIEFEVSALLNGRSAVMLQSHPLNILYRRIRAIVDGRN